MQTEIHVCQWEQHGACPGTSGKHSLQPGMSINVNIDRFIYPTVDPLQDLVNIEFLEHCFFTYTSGCFR